MANLPGLYPKSDLDTHTTGSFLLSCSGSFNVSLKNSRSWDPKKVQCQEHTDVNFTLNSRRSCPAVKPLFYVNFGQGQDLILFTHKVLVIIIVVIRRCLYLFICLPVYLSICQCTGT